MKKKNEHLQYIASHDPLTGLYNRTYFMEMVDGEVIRNKRMDGEACIILLDIDYFKQINDNVGHPAGDKILKDTAKIITSQLRQSDVPARLGGEEFIILLTETNLESGRVVSEKLRKEIQDFSFQFEGQCLNITASLGVAKLEDSFDTCYRQVDQALYNAKKQGRNCTVIAKNYT